MLYPFHYKGLCCNEFNPAILMQPIDSGMDNNHSGLICKYVIMVYCFHFQGRNKSDSNLSRPSSEYRRGSQRGTPQPEDSSEDIPPREPTPVPTASVFMQAIDWLLEVKAVPVSGFIYHIFCLCKPLIGCWKSRLFQ